MNNKLEAYLQERDELIYQIQETKYDDLLFNKEEEKANTVFRGMITTQRKNIHPSFYRGNSMKHKALIDANDLFKVIKKMPKGAVLHLHIDCAIDPDFFLEIAYNENVYLHTETKQLIYRAKSPNDEKYVKLIDKRKASENIAKFDKDFKESLSISSEDYDQGSNIWDIFINKIIQTNPLIFYSENFKKYLMNVFKNFMEEGVSHIEARALLGSVLDEDGIPLSYEDELDVYRYAIKETQKNEPDFSFKLICQGLKCWDLDQIDQYLRDVIKLKKNHGDIIVGFDLVQEEDKHKTMVNLSKVLIRKEEYEKKMQVELPFVLHGGESLNLSTESLFDLILLKTKRIGHGLNLIKHSYLMDIIKKEKIGIEICPFSNQLLGYVEDLRLHPAITFLNYGLKVTINPDDPGFFRNRYINYDFFFCAAAMEFDLKDFKRVILNSIECSLLDEKEKKKHEINFNKKWKIFIDEFLNIYHNYANRKSIVGGESFEIPAPNSKKI